MFFLFQLNYLFNYLNFVRAVFSYNNNLFFDFFSALLVPRVLQKTKERFAALKRMGSNSPINKLRAQFLHSTAQMPIEGGIPSSFLRNT